LDGLPPAVAGGERDLVGEIEAAVAGLQLVARRAGLLAQALFEVRQEGDERGPALVVPAVLEEMERVPGDEQSGVGARRRVPAGAALPDLDAFLARQG